MQLAKKVIETAPQNLTDAGNQDWQDESRLYDLVKAGDLRAPDSPDFQSAKDYWLIQFPQMHEKTRSSIVATFTAGTKPFWSMLTSRNYTIYICQNGTIQLLDKKTDAFKPANMDAIEDPIVKSAFLDQIGTQSELIKKN